jgi:sulfur carrier protein ThiS
MNIEVKLLTQFKQYLPNPGLPGNSRTLSIKENVSIQDVLTELGMPIDTPKVVMLNDRHGTLQDVLKEGDRVTVFPPVGGG